MLTPYDWQEGIGNRAQFIEARLEQGAPVLALSITEGIVVFTHRRQGRKIFEIYDRLVFGGIGQQSDIEALRSAAVEFAHQEGYNRSEQDVTIQRVATALSTPLKKAFSDFSTAPFVARAVFGEVGEKVEDDLYFTLDYDGDFSVCRRSAMVAGSEFATRQFEPKLEAMSHKLSPEDALAELKEIWASTKVREDEDQEGEVTVEAVLLERREGRENRFRVLERADF